MENIKSLDIYSNNINLNLKGEEKIKSFSGGILSILTLVLSFFVSYLFGEDFYYRINPKSITEIVSPLEFTYSPVKDLQIAWRIEDDSGLEINLTNIIFPSLTYYNSMRNKTDNSYYTVEQTKINLTRCDNQNLNNEFNKKFNSSLWNCFDLQLFEDKILGGDYTAQKLSYLEFNINSCSDNDVMCSNKDVLTKIFKNSYYFTIIFPQLVYSSSNLETPIDTKFKTIYYNLHNLMYVENKCDLYKYVLSDDQGWILPSPQNLTDITFGECQQSYKIINPEDYNKNTSVILMTNDIYLNKDYIYSKRTFMKIQDLIAISGGFISSIRLLIGIINGYFFQFEKNKIFLKELFFNIKSINYKEKIDNNLDIPNNFDSRYINSENINKKFNVMNYEININQNSEKIKTEENFRKINIKNGNIQINLESKTIQDVELKSLKNYPKSFIDKNLNVNEFNFEKNLKNNLNEKTVIKENLNDNFQEKKIKEEFICTELVDLNDNDNKYKNVVFVIPFKEKIKKFENCKNNFSKLNIFSYYMTIFCRLCKRKKKNISLKIVYDQSVKKIKKKMDIIYQIKNLQFLKILKNLIFNKNHQLLIKDYFKYTFNEKDEEIKILKKENKHEMFEYFQNFSIKNQENLNKTINEFNINNFVLTEFNRKFDNLNKLDYYNEI